MEKEDLDQFTLIKINQQKNQFRSSPKLKMKKHGNNL